MELAGWISETPVSKVSRLCSADIRPWDSAELPKPDNSFVGSPLDSIERADQALAKNVGSCQ